MGRDKMYKNRFRLLEIPMFQILSEPLVSSVIQKAMPNLQRDQ